MNLRCLWPPPHGTTDGRSRWPEDTSVIDSGQRSDLESARPVAGWEAARRLRQRTTDAMNSVGGVGCGSTPGLFNRPTQQPAAQTRSGQATASDLPSRRMTAAEPPDPSDGHSNGRHPRYMASGIGAAMLGTAI